MFMSIPIFTTKIDLSEIVKNRAKCKGKETQIDICIKATNPFLYLA